jgi:hypothetical protein
MFFNFSTPVLIRHLWQLKSVVFLHWCLKLAVVLAMFIFYYGVYTLGQNVDWLAHIRKLSQGETTENHCNLLNSKTFGKFCTGAFNGTLIFFSK